MTLFLKVEKTHLKPLRLQITMHKDTKKAKSFWISLDEKMQMK